MAMGLLVSMFDATRIKAGDCVKMTTYTKAGAEVIRYGSIKEITKEMVHITICREDSRTYTLTVIPDQLIEGTCALEIL